MAVSAPPRARVVVADDSGFMRQVLTSALRDEGFEIVGVARDGDEALELCAKEQPDAMTLDLAMPGTDGIEALRTLRQGHGGSGVPVVVVSAFSPEHGARAVDALAEGAFDLVAKPSGRDGMTAFVRELGDKVRLAARSRRRTRRAAPSAATPRRTPARRRTGDGRLVFVASSTGGPRALAAFLPELPEELGLGTVVVQHMPAGFTNSLAARLDRASRLHVKEAEAGDAIAPGGALVAPGGRHLRLNANRTVTITDDAPIRGLRPRADLAIEDVARIWGERVLLVVLTGMGDDGLAGAREVRRRGGRIVAEAESSCAVYGMPRAVVEARLADHVLELDDLPACVTEEAWA